MKREIVGFLGVGLLLVLVASARAGEQPTEPMGPAALARARALVDALGSADVELRRSSLQALMKLAPVCEQAGAVDALVGLARSDPDTQVRELALQLLGEIGPVAADRVVPMALELMDVQQRQPGRVRGWAVFALGKMKPPLKLVAKRLVPLLLLPDDFLSAAVQGALVDIGEPVLPLLLVLYLQTKDTYPKRRMLAAMAAFGPEARAMVPELLRLRKAERDERLRKALLGAVLEILPKDDPERVELLIGLLPELTGYQRYRLISELGEAGPGAAAALPALVAELDAKNEDVRERALGAIAEIVTPETAGDLPARLAPLLEGGYWTANKAARALSRMGPAGRRVLLAATGHEKSRVRRFAWEALAAKGQPPLGMPEALVVRMSSEDDSTVRQAMAGALSAHGPEALASLLAALETETDGQVRAALFRGLAACGPKALAPLRAALGEEKGAAAGAVLWALGELGPAAAEAVPDLLALRGSYVIGDGVKAVEKIGPAALPALVEGLGDPDPKTRAQAAYAFGLLGPAAVPEVEALARAIGDPDPRVRQWAAWAAGALGPGGDYAIEDLQAALIDPTREVRENAARSLGALGPEAVRALPDLIPLLEDPHLFVAEKAAETIGRFGPKAAEAVPALVRALTQHEHGSARRGAAKALGKIGVGSLAVRTALRKALSDPKARVRWAAGEALLVVGEPADAPAAQKAIRLAPEAAQKEDLKAMRKFNRMLMP